MAVQKKIQLILQTNTFQVCFLKDTTKIIACHNLISQYFALVLI